MEAHIKREISDTTLLCCDTYNYGGAVASLKKCMEKCKFEHVIFFTNIPLKLEGITVIQIEELNGKDGYSQFMLKEAYKYISSDFILVVQHDSWILDAEQFDERLYDVDYVGALWLENDGLANGNGGFSWRSYKLMEAVGKDELINATTPEDVALCRVYRRYLEKNYGLIWANDEMCEQFSFELRCPVKSTFGFHNFFHPPYQKTVVIVRKAALGDVVKVEPVMRYFHDKGYRVVLDTLPQFYWLFLNHDFKVHKLNEIDQRLLETAKFINLDGSYEAEPELNHLVAYFKYAGIQDVVINKPKLTVGFELNKETKLFPKLALIHYDKRGQNSRNIFGIDWEKIVSHLISKDYTVLQIGKGEHQRIKGANEINITNEHFLCYVVGSADIFIGADSGPSNIAVAFNVPSVIFFGGVDANIIHADLTDVEIIDNGVCCEKPKCWHKAGAGATAGMPCIVDESAPPCIQFDTSKVILAIDKLVG